MTKSLSGVFVNPGHTVDVTYLVLAPCCPLPFSLYDQRYSRLPS